MDENGFGSVINYVAYSITLNDSPGKVVGYALHCYPPSTGVSPLYRSYFPEEVLSHATS